MVSFVKNASVSVALAGLMLGGCYAQRPLDEELSEDVEADAARPDAGAPAVDAAAPRCTGTDPIALLLCQLSPPATAEQPAQQAAIPDLSSLLGSLGGLANIAQVLGPIVGNTGTGTRPPAAGQPAGGLVDLVNLAGGLGNIAQLFNQLLGGVSLLPTLFGNAQQPAQQPQQVPSIQDFLNGLGIPVAGPDTTITQEPTKDECAKPTTPAQQFACALQQSL